jgi:hypothetical protein
MKSPAASNAMRSQHDSLVPRSPADGALFPGVA